MNAEQLLDYALGQVDGAALESCEAELALDAGLARRVAQVRSGLDALLDDGQDLEPPIDLRGRTMALVAAQPVFRKSDWAPRRVPFRAADLAVAAAVLLAGVATLAPAVLRMRSQYETAACINQLQQLGMGLMAYSVDHGHYPKPPANHPAGYFGIQLIKDGKIDSTRSLVCPSRSPHAELLGLSRPEEFDALHRDDPAGALRLLDGVYAYHPGYRGKSRGASPLPKRLTSRTPLLADSPPVDRTGSVIDGNSPNHGGNGQYVLFSDNHVEWLPTRRMQLDDDIFLNRVRKVDLGVDSMDAALLPAIWRIRE
jgi:hypothetical protein